MTKVRWKQNFECFLTAGLYFFVYLCYFLLWCPEKLSPILLVGGMACFWGSVQRKGRPGIGKSKRQQHSQAFPSLLLRSFFKNSWKKTWLLFSWIHAPCKDIHEAWDSIFIRGTLMKSFWNCHIKLFPTTFERNLPPALEFACIGLFPHAVLNNCWLAGR